MCEEHASLAAWKAHLDAAHHRGTSHNQSGACFRHSSCERDACLPQGTHIVFAGDSTTRYQYLQLSYALRNGVENLNDGFQSINSERSWPSQRSSQKRWGVFTNTTNAWLQVRSSKLINCTGAHLATREARPRGRLHFVLTTPPLAFLHLFLTSSSPSSPSSFQPHELCDCYRSTSDLRGFRTPAGLSVCTVCLYATNRADE